MDTEVGVGMSLRPRGHFGKPGAGNQNARGGNPSFLQCFEDGAVYRVVHAEVISVDDQQTRSRRITEALLRRLGPQRQGREQKKQKPGSVGHGKTSSPMKETDYQQRK